MKDVKIEDIYWMDKEIVTKKNELEIFVIIENIKLLIWKRVVDKKMFEINETCWRIRGLWNKKILLR